MPRSSTGKWVARAGATGGGRTYRGQTPVNWYAVLVLIVVLGLGSVVFARYEYQNPSSAANTIAPTKGTQWFAAAVFDLCGTQATLSSNQVNPTKQSFVTTGDGVVQIDPKSTADAGNNAVLGKLLAGYRGLSVTPTEIKLPASSLGPASAPGTTPATSTTPTTGSSSTAGASSTTSTTTGSTSTTASGSSSGSKLRSKKPKSKTAKRSSTKTSTAPVKAFKNGGACPAGTKDAGKKGYVHAVYWSNAFASKAKPISVSNAGSIKFAADQLITIGFLPKGTAVPKPNGTVVTALLGASTGAGATTSTTAGSGSTTSTTSAKTTTSST